LGPERTSKIKIVGKDEVEGSFYGQLVLGKGVVWMNNLSRKPKRLVSICY